MLKNSLDNKAASVHKPTSDIKTRIFRSLEEIWALRKVIASPTIELRNTHIINHQPTQIDRLRIFFCPTAGSAVIGLFDMMNIFRKQQR